MNKLFRVTNLVTLFLCSPLVFGEIELKQKALDQALKDLETSKKQASLLLDEKLKEYDLNRLPPHYKKMLEEKLYGAAVTPEMVGKLRAKYEKVISATMESTAGGNSGNLAQLNASFKSAMKGQLKSGTVKVVSNKAVSDINKKKLQPSVKSNSKKLKNLQENTLTSMSSADEINAEESLKLSRFVKDNNDLLSTNKVNTIFDRHSQVYLNEIYKKIK